MSRIPSLRRRLLVALTLVATALPAAAGVRLGTAVVPTSQSIDLWIDPAQESFSGSTEIRLAVREATDRFSFHAEEMEIGSLALAGPEGAVEVSFAPGEDRTVKVTAAEPLAPGEYTLAIAFSRLLDTHAIGLYRMEAGDGAYAFTQFEPDDARMAFPCWDEPGFKIPFRVTVAVPEGQIAVSNTPVESERSAGGWHTFVFAPTRPLPSYLVAIAAGPLESIEIPGMGVPGRIYTVHGQSQLTATAAGMAAPLLHALEGWFGTPYPYEKLDFVAIPEYWPGAMENPGLITFADRILVRDPATQTTAWRRTVAGVAAHEMGHALQDAQNYAPLALRSAMVPAVQFGSWLGPLIFMAGFFLHLTNIAWLGVIVFAAVALFAVVTLPVEFDASSRAKKLLASQGLLYGQELQGVNTVLNAAALTYVAGAIQAISTLLYYVFILTNRRD